MIYARGNPARWWKSRSCGIASRAPTALAIGPFRKLLSGTLLAVLALFLIGVWYITNPARIGPLAENLLSNVFGGHVSIRYAHLSFSGTLLLSGVELQTDPSPSAPRPLPVFSADEIEARFDWLSLFSGHLSATQLIAVAPVVTIIEDPGANRWNYELLHSGSAVEGRSVRRSGQGGGLPVVILRSACVQFAELHAGRIELTAQSTVDGQLIPDASWTYHFQITRHGNALARVTASSSEYLVSGTWDVARNRFAAATERIALDEDLKSALPRSVRKWWDDHHLQGNLAQLRLTFDHDEGLVFYVSPDGVSFTCDVQPEPAESGAPPETFAVPFSNLRGLVRLGISKPSLELTNLRGRVMSYPFAADANLRGLSPESPFEVNLKFKNAYLSPDYPPLFIATLAAQDLLERTSPWGNFDLALSIKRLSWNGALFVEGDLTCKNAHMRFCHFPYPLDHLTGNIHFNNETVTFQNVTAWGDETPVTLNGVIGTVYENPLVDFTVASDDASFDDRMGACLPEKYQDIWDQFAIRGHGKFVCKVERPASATPHDNPVSTVWVTLDDGRGYMKLFPYPLDHARGKITFTADQTLVQSLSVRSGLDDSGRLLFDGVVKHPGGDVSNLQPELQLTADVPIDESLLNCFPRKYAEALRQYNPTGRLGFTGFLKRNTDLSSPIPADISGDLMLKNVTLSMPGQHLTLTGLAASAHIASTELSLREGTARTPEGLHLAATGKADLATGVANLDLSASAEDLVLPASPPMFLPENLRSFWSTYQPSGKIDLTAYAKITFGRQPTTAPAATQNTGLAGNGASYAGLHIDDWYLSLTAKNAALAKATWPEPIRDITGKISANPQKVSFEDIHAAAGPVAFGFSGAFEPSGKCVFTGAALADSPPVKWYSKLPAGVANFLEANKPTGQIQLKLQRLERAAWGEPWLFGADLDLHHMATNGPATSLALAANCLSLDIKDATYKSGGGVDISQGVLAATDLAVSGKNIDALTASLTALSADKSLKFSDIDGKVAGGVLRGSITAQFEENPGYQADLTLSDAELASLALPKTASEEEKKKIGTGRVTATLALQQTFGDAHGKGADRTGRGDLVVRDGKIYNVPLAMGLMQLATLRLPVSRAFDAASMTYYLRDNQVTFEKILLESPGINLAGNGTLSLKSTPPALDLNFVTESPNPNELHIPLLSDLWRGTQNQLLQIAVTGNLDDPKVTPVPLNPIFAPLQLLLPHNKKPEGP